jgi:hypothetical protein
LANEEERKIKEMFADWKEEIKRTKVMTVYLIIRNLY